MEQIKNKKFILKVILYIAALLCPVYDFLIALAAIPPMLLLWGVFLNDKIQVIVNNNFDIFLLYPICSPFASYMLAKLFGIFKFIDNLKTNLFNKLLYLFLIAILSSLVLFIRFGFVEKDVRFGLFISSLIFTLIPAFFLYKYFQYLTKKFPQPFEKIGYYCSIEFFKDTIKNLSNI